MVRVEFVDGSEETFETRDCVYSPWGDSPSGDFYIIPTIEGDAWCNKEFVKCIRYIEV